LRIGSILIKQNYPVVMGVLNVTPDSFSDGGMYYLPDKALFRAEEMIKEGVSIIDVGGESTRPGAAPVSVDEELARTIPVIEKIVRWLDIAVSIDTSHPLVMKEAVNAGAHLINDVRALTVEGALDFVAETSVPVCLMHMSGSPETMQDHPCYENILNTVQNYLQNRIKQAVISGISTDRLLIDPGFGFGKNLTHNLTMLKYLSKFNDLGCPLLVGLSRKTMIGSLLGKDVDNRVFGSVGAAVIAAMNGAAIIRAHDIRETVDALTIVQAVNNLNKSKQGRGGKA